MRRGSRILVACAWMVVLPRRFLLRGSITGVVGDTSGAVLPGVTVEASSPALIEKVRSVVTDGTGQLPNCRSASWQLHALLHAAGFQRREARGKSN